MTKYLLQTFLICLFILFFIYFTEIYEYQRFNLPNIRVNEFALERVKRATVHTLYKIKLNIGEFEMGDSIYFIKIN